MMKFEQPISQEYSREQLAEEIRGLLRNERFSVNPRLNEYFAHEIENTDRFVSIPGMHEEGGVRKERFLKIPVSAEFDELFKRQVDLTRYLKQDGHIPIRDVISANTERSEGVPYAIMETFEASDARIGYISSYEGGELLGEKEATGTVNALDKLHAVDTAAMPQELRESLIAFPDSFEGFRQEIMDIVDQKVRPLDAPQRRRTEPLHEVLGRRFSVDQYREKVEELLRRWEEVIRAAESERAFLVHGDLGPGNIYVYDSGEIEPVDYEHAGLSGNEILASVVDFGNFRARAWNNGEFREALDRAVLERYRGEDREEMGKAIVSLGILRSHMLLAGFFESYPHGKQRDELQTLRRETTEDDLIKAWQIAGLGI